MVYTVPCTVPHVISVEIQDIYRILHDLSFDINFYKTRYGNVIKQAFGE